MALAVLGPANGDDVALGRATAHFVEMPEVERVIYLGADGLMDEIVAAWAHSLVGDDPTDNGIWARAASACAGAVTPEAIDRFVVAERRRSALRCVHSVADEAAWTIELLGGRWTLVAASLGRMTEEHLASVSFVIFGDATEPVMERRGPRWVLSPGPIGKSSGLLLDESGGTVTAKLFGGDLAVIREEQLVVGQATKVRVADGNGG